MDGNLMCEPQSPNPAATACQGGCNAAQRAACPLLAMMAKLDMPLRQTPMGEPIIPPFRSIRKPRPAQKPRYGRSARRLRQTSRQRRCAGFIRRARQTACT
ncbi:MAG: hypothetical protein AAF641_01415 [Pseudomonadota bacterium]